MCLREHWGRWVWPLHLPAWSCQQSLRTLGLAWQLLCSISHLNPGRIVDEYCGCILIWPYTFPESSSPHHVIPNNPSRRQVDNSMLSVSSGITAEIYAIIYLTNRFKRNMSQIKKYILSHIQWYPRNTHAIHIRIRLREGTVILNPRGV